MSLKRRLWADHQHGVIDMNDVQLSTLEQIREFLVGTAEVAFTPVCEDVARCRFVSAVRVRRGYATLGRGDKGLIGST